MYLICSDTARIQNIIDVQSRHKCVGIGYVQRHFGSHNWKIGRKGQALASSFLQHERGDDDHHFMGYLVDNYYIQRFIPQTPN